MVGLIDKCQLETQVWIKHCSVIRAREGRWVFREGGMLWELSACVQGKKKIYCSRIPVFITMIFQHINAVFCTITVYVTAVMIHWVIQIRPSHHRTGRGGGDFGRV